MYLPLVLFNGVSHGSNQVPAVHKRHLSDLLTTTLQGKGKSSLLSNNVVPYDVLRHCSLFLLTRYSDVQLLQPSIHTTCVFNSSFNYCSLPIFLSTVVPSHYPQLTPRKGKIRLHGKGVVCGNGNGQTHLTQ